MAFDLRPLTLAELLDRSFSIYKRHLWLFVGIMAVPASVALFYGFAMQLLQFAGLIKQPGAVPGTPPEQALQVFGPLVVAALVFLVLYITIYAFALGATTIAVAHVYKDQPLTVGAAYRQVRRHGIRLILLMIWGTLRIGGLWMALIVASAVLGGLLSAIVSPLIGPIVLFVAFLGSSFFAGYLAIRYGVAVPAVVLESLTAGQALSRSVDLTEDHRGRVFLLIACAIVIAYATTLLLQGPFMVGAILAGPESTTALVLNLTGAVFGTIGSMFSGPIMIIGLAMIYYDLRIRKEALDLHMMLEALDASRT